MSQPTRPRTTVVVRRDDITSQRQPALGGPLGAIISDWLETRATYARVNLVKAQSAEIDAHRHHYHAQTQFAAEQLERKNTIRKALMESDRLTRLDQEITLLRQMEPEQASRGLKQIATRELMIAVLAEVPHLSHDH